MRKVKLELIGGTKGALCKSADKEESLSFHPIVFAHGCTMNPNNEVQLELIGGT